MQTENNLVDSAEWPTSYFLLFMPVVYFDSLLGQNMFSGIFLLFSRFSYFLSKKKKKKQKNLCFHHSLKLVYTQTNVISLRGYPIFKFFHFIYENGQKKYFDQLLSAAHKPKLAKIHNIPITTHSNVLILLYDK